MAQTWRVSNRRPPQPPPPLDAEALERAALSYVGRFATSRAGLERYLARKLAQRGWAGAIPPDPAGIAARMVELGYVDDRGLAEARGRSLARRGYGVRRVAASLDGLGIAREDAADVLAAAEQGGWESALRYAERRRIGPFAASPTDQPARRRALAAMLRAGHGLDHARRIVAAAPGNVPDRDE